MQLSEENKESEQSNGVLAQSSPEGTPRVPEELATSHASELEKTISEHDSLPEI